MQYITRRNKMKKVIKNKLYDTDTAKLLGEYIESLIGE